MHSHSSCAAILGDTGGSRMDTCLLCTPSPVITEALQTLHICVALHHFHQAPVIPAPLPQLLSPIRIVQIFPLAAFWSFHGSRDLVHKSCWPCWGGGWVREEQERLRNPICTVFLQACCFFLPRQASLISCFQTARWRSSVCGWRPWQLSLTIFPSCTGGKREGE